MFGMALADVMGSISMALNTLPMPSYMPREEEFGYNFKGNRIGNVITCNIQGFFATFGIVVMFGYNAGLCMYYACSIAIGMRDKVIQKYVEPFLHMLPLFCGLAYSVPPLVHELYNPGVGAFVWCCVTPYPDECGNNSYECIRGRRETMNNLMKVMSSFIYSALTIIIVSMTMVLWKVFQTNRLLTELSEIYNRRGIHDRRRVHLQQRNERHRTSKVIFVQVSLYLLASLLGLVPPMLRVTRVVSSNEQNTSAQLKALANIDRVILVFLPLQGFFNFVIFVSHKIYNYRRVHRNVSICNVLGLLFQGSGNDPTIMISRISIVDVDHQHKNGDCIGDPYLIEFNMDYDKQHQRKRSIAEDASNPVDENFHFRLDLYRSQALQQPEDLASDTRLFDSAPQENQEMLVGTTTDTVEVFDDDEIVEEDCDVQNYIQEDMSSSFPSKSPNTSPDHDVEKSTKKRRYYTAMEK
jgi:hypothetical protein